MQHRWYLLAQQHVSGAHCRCWHRRLAVATCFEMMSKTLAGLSLHVIVWTHAHVLSAESSHPHACCHGITTYQELVVYLMRR